MRPQFHFTARGWINDPHGVTFANGTYHVFFQYVPGSTTWSVGCWWGHASGPDLFSLTELPAALAPGEGDDGIWSGSLLVSADGSPRILYTSATAGQLALGRIRTATTTDPNWVTWEKGPVVAAAPQDADIRVFRDPVIIADGDDWRMLVGASLDDGVAAAIGYSSSDGVTWHSDGVIASRSSHDRDPVWSGTMWECPQIIEVDGRHAVIVSVWDDDVLYDVLYALGDYQNGEFSPTSWGRLSYGPSLYAATAFRDRSDQACVMFWLRGIGGEGWEGAHSIPYRLGIDGERLSLSPHPDLDQYRDDTATSGSAADILWPPEVEATLEIVQGGSTIVAVDRDEHELRIRIGEDTHVAPWAGEVRVIVDGPVLEISSLSGAFASRIPPLGEDWDLLGSGLVLRRLRQHSRA